MTSQKKVLQNQKSNITMTPNSSRKRSIFKFNTQADLIQMQESDELGFSVGKALASKQKKLLNEETFQKVLTLQQLNKLTVDWQVFNKGSFDSPVILLNFKRIKRYVQQFCDLNPNVKELQVLFQQLKDFANDIKEAQYTQLVVIAVNYFKKMFSKYRFTTMNKLQGIQVGKKIIFHPLQLQQKEIIYHVKTHSLGIVSYKQIIPKTVNPNQLITYRILQKIGFGCEYHYFGKNLQTLYIATKDAGFENDYFSYQNISKNIKFVEFLKSSQFCRGIFSLAIITEIMKLSDLLTNSGNFGFSYNKERRKWQIKIVDFRAPQFRYLRYYKISEEEYDNYMMIDKTTDIKDQNIIALFQRQIYNLTEITEDIFLNQLKQFPKIVEESQKDILQKMPLNIIQPIQNEIESIKETLNMYTTALKYNYDYFKQRLRKNSFSLQKQIEI